LLWATVQLNVSDQIKYTGMRVADEHFEECMQIATEIESNIKRLLEHKHS
jgi:hypothetical protein